MRRADEVYEQLKTDIANLVLAPGDPLPESDLAVRLGASRTPIREALQRLSNEGLVRVIPGRGAFVKEISLDGVMELYELRECLEVFAARLGARSRQRTQLASWVNAFRDCIEELESGQEFDRVGHLDFVFDLHRVIGEIAGNQQLNDAMSCTWTQSRRICRLTQQDDVRLRASMQEHLELAEAIAMGDETRAAEVAENHVRNSLATILQVVPSSGFRSPPALLRRADSFGLTASA